MTKWRLRVSTEWVLMRPTPRHDLTRFLQSSEGIHRGCNGNDPLAKAVCHITGVSASSCLTPSHDFTGVLHGRKCTPLRRAYDRAHAIRELAGNGIAIATGLTVAPSHDTAGVLQSRESRSIRTNGPNASRKAVCCRTAIATIPTIAPSHDLAGLLQGRERRSICGNARDAPTEAICNIGAIAAVPSIAPNHGLTRVLQGCESTGSCCDRGHTRCESVCHITGVSTAFWITPSHNLAGVLQSSESISRCRNGDDSPSEVVCHGTGISAAVRSTPRPSHDSKADEHDIDQHLIVVASTLNRMIVHHQIGAMYKLEWLCDHGLHLLAKPRSEQRLFEVSGPEDGHAR
mmetsp:Transcript_72210/g.234546  ORF Transcript_72210/g.234546 Transcript_72210/m.234546 type:complete len:345 (+) Transcript_72210:225-1259(+)